MEQPTSNDLPTPAIKREAPDNANRPNPAKPLFEDTPAAPEKPETNTPRTTEVAPTPRENQRPDLEVGVVPPYDQGNVARIKADQEAAQQ